MFQSLFHSFWFAFSPARHPKVTIPIRPGRNVASIIEVAARNHLLKAQGHNSAHEFKALLEERLQVAGAQGMKEES